MPHLPYCAICERLRFLKGNLFCGVLPNNIPVDTYPWGCSLVDPPPSSDRGFEPLPGMEEVVQRWKDLDFLHLN